MYIKVGPHRDLDIYFKDGLFSGPISKRGHRGPVVIYEISLQRDWERHYLQVVHVYRFWLSESCVGMGGKGGDDWRIGWFNPGIWSFMARGSNSPKWGQAQLKAIFL